MDLSNLSYLEIETYAQKCDLCVLKKTRTKVVFGSGPVPCDIMLIGEGPGEQEDLSGLPFVGRAGQLLTKILESVNIKRPDDIYIANIVKCRPPENRAPLPAETRACFPYLLAQIRLIQPKIILVAGAPSSKVVLNNEEPMSKIRGKWQKLGDISVMPIFHPSYLLRNAGKEKGGPKWLTWKDMQEVRNALDYLKRVRELEKTSK
jgi:DNA polymerase